MTVQNFQVLTSSAWWKHRWFESKNVYQDLLRVAHVAKQISDLSVIHFTHFCLLKKANSKCTKSYPHLFVMLTDIIVLKLILLSPPKCSQKPSFHLHKSVLMFGTHCSAFVINRDIYSNLGHKEDVRVQFLQLLMLNHPRGLETNFSVKEKIKITFLRSFFGWFSHL